MAHNGNCSQFPADGKRRNVSVRRATHSWASVRTSVTMYASCVAAPAGATKVPTKMWCRKCRDVAQKSCDDAGHTRITLTGAFHKLHLKGEAERRLKKAMNQPLGYAARLYMYVQGDRSDEDDGVEFFSGSLTLTLATTTLTHLQALEMCDVMDRCILTNRRRKDKFAKGRLDMKIPHEILSKLPERPVDEFLRKRAVLATPTGHALKMFLRTVAPSEFPNYSKLLGFYEYDGTHDPVDVQWHKKVCHKNEWCYQCNGKGSAPQAKVEDAALRANGDVSSVDSSSELNSTVDEYSSSSSSEDL